ncbi:hypothetical protein LCGC14_1978260 [marine sediment metagenome]|uniref:Uncharacterized protein n=1 Tax=marine sediment metagenome TaxID=412755 RepID=A0A0F9FA00_9ZZZZ
MNETIWMFIIGLSVGILITAGFFMLEHDVYFEGTGCDLIRPQKSCLEICESIYETQIKDLKEQIEWLEDVADISGDTWREGDCGIEIWRQQEEEGIVPFEVWKKSGGR